MLTVHLPPDLESTVQAAVHDGRFASVDDAITQALRLLLHQQPAPAGKPLSVEELEQELLESGFLASVPPPRDHDAPAWQFDPVKIEGEPLSETVIRERR
jgi:Arc/MetJ-type ribon-helix-helix transcriptional regulator